MENKLIKTAFYLAIASGVAFIGFIVLALFIDEIGMAGGFRIVVVPLAIVSLVLATQADKDTTLSMQDKKIKKITLWMNAIILGAVALLFILVLLAFLPGLFIH